MEHKKLNEQELEQVTGGGELSNEDVIRYQKAAELDAGIVGRGKNGNPTLVLWDEASAGLIADPEKPGSGNVGSMQK